MPSSLRVRAPWNGHAARHPARRSAGCVVRIAAPSTEPLSWVEISGGAGAEALKNFYIQPGQIPTSSPTPIVRTAKDTKSNKPVLLYRDQNGWCPFCQMVWMTLIEKDVPFDSMLIDLADKPVWYSEVVSTGKTPAVKIGGNVTVESYDIIQLLEEKFRLIPLMPKDAGARDACKEFMDDWVKSGKQAVLNKGWSALTFGRGTADSKADLVAILDDLEAMIERSGGPYLFGDFSLADILLAPRLPRLQWLIDSAVNTEAHPRVAALCDALGGRHSFQLTTVDRGTAVMLAKRKLQAELSAPVQVDMRHVPDHVMKKRCEAAAKVAANRTLIAQRLVRESGVMRSHGSPLGGTVRNVNGRLMNVYEEGFLVEAENALQRLCSFLLTDVTDPVPGSREAASVHVAMLAYFRNMAAAPRDMSAGAVDELRKGCDAVIAGSFAC